MELNEWKGRVMKVRVSDEQRARSPGFAPQEVSRPALASWGGAQDPRALSVWPNLTGKRALCHILSGILRKSFMMKANWSGCSCCAEACTVAWEQGASLYSPHRTGHRALTCATHAPGSPQRVLCVDMVTRTTARVQGSIMRLSRTPHCGGH